MYNPHASNTCHRLPAISHSRAAAHSSRFPHSRFLLQPFTRFGGLAAIIFALFAFASQGWGQTYYSMSSGNYLQTFSGNLVTSGHQFGSGNLTNWNGVRNGTSTAIPSAGNLTVNATAVILPSTTGGIQGNATIGAMLFLSTSSTDNSTSVAADLNLNFTNRIAGSLTFNASQVANTSGNRTSTLRIYYSTNNSSWTELTGTNLPFEAVNNVSKNQTISASLPSAFSGNSTAKLRFYYHNGGTAAVATPGGSRPKIGVDDVAVTSTPSSPHHHFKNKQRLIPSQIDLHIHTSHPPSKDETKAQKLTLTLSPHAARSTWALASSTELWVRQMERKAGKRPFSTASANALAPSLPT